jgi:hypothetical protein
MIMADRCVTVKQLSLQLDIGEASVCRILEKLGYTKVCARWVPQQLTDALKEQWKTICSELLEWFENVGDNFLTRIVTGDETWLHYYEPETKRQSVEWHHANSPRKKKVRAAPSAGKVMATVFWDMEGLLLVDIMPKGTTSIQRHTWRHKQIFMHICTMFDHTSRWPTSCSSMTMPVLTSGCKPRRPSTNLGGGIATPTLQS